MNASSQFTYFSLIKSVVGVFYVYFVFLVCHFSFYIIVAATAISGISISLKGFFLSLESQDARMHALSQFTYCQFKLYLMTTEHLN